ncbi:ABC transporter substrate-binding protein [Thermicanus aegyptius]|uniref:ABC transporter substrate-binding protein n=1 Tax=Thermicanus aegyptius TaxID=94009 RepID=UPI0004132A9F|nr:ABC transporter substrate-binding protein [Thermicanus aegyptius]
MGEKRWRREEMRRVVVGMVALLFALSVILGGCGQGGPQGSQPSNGNQGATDAGTSGEAGKEQEKTFKIGLTQIVEHPALDAIRQGILKGLEEHGFTEGKNLVIDYQNAQNDRNNATNIAQKFVAEKVDLIIAITTPSAQAAAQATKEIPIVFSAVTDPVAAGLVAAFDRPGENITGTSDLVPISRQVELMQKFLPNLKTIGIVYNSGEVNAEVQVKEAEKAAQEKGIKVEALGVSNNTEIQQAAESLAGKIDAYLVLVDNMIVAGFDTLQQVAEKAKIPVFASDSDTVKRGAVATYGLDQFQIGVQTGVMASRILRGESPKNIPVEVLKEVSLTVNPDAVKKYGLTLSDELKKEMEKTQAK